jgi:hypothetical protein
MQQGKDQSSNELIDSVSSFEAGVNMGVAPVLLQKNQLGNSVNTTLRGDLLRPRPPYRLCPAVFNPHQTIQNAFQTGNFQGAAYYKPDSGPESLISSVGGRIYQVTPTNPGGANYPQAIVNEITPAGDPNPATQSQAWIWQAEKWAIINDGVSIPFFFDGNSSRRALQAPPVIGTVTTQVAAPAAQGDSVELILSQPYTNGADYPVYISNGVQTDEYTVSPLAGAQLTLTNVTGQVGKVIPGGTNVAMYTVLGTLVSVSYSAYYLYSGAGSSTALETITYTSPLGVTEQVSWYVGFGQETIPPAYAVYNGLVYALTTSYSLSGNYPNYGPTSLSVVGTALPSSLGAFTVPPIGETVVVSLQSSYSGQVGYTVFIGGAQYTVTAINNNVNNVVEATFVNQVPPLTSSIVPLLNPIPAGATVTFGIPGYELPPGRMGVCVSGRNWVSLPDQRSFVASDLVGDPSGTSINQYRDAVLKVTENTYLVGGGTFSVPLSCGGITGMIGLASLNSEFNAGPLEILTPTTLFSINTPVNRSEWASTTNPLEAVSIISNGGVGQNSALLANGDLIYRALDGLRSLILTQSTFFTWGNPPLSREISPVLDADPQNLLQFASAVVFNNRLLLTTNPTKTAQGVVWNQLAVMNFDPVSSLRGKAPSIYDSSYWQDMSVLQLVTGMFAGVQRCFAFVVDANNLIQLMEILPFGSVTNPNVSGDAPTWQFDLPFIFKDSQRQFKTLNDADIFIDQINGPVEVQAWLRPDYDTQWWPWNDFSIPAIPSYQPRLPLDQPPRQFNPANQRAVNDGYTFQVRIQIKGWCRFLGAKFYANKKPEPQFPAMTEIQSAN